MKIGSGLNLPLHGSRVAHVTGLDPSPRLLGKARQAVHALLNDIISLDTTRMRKVSVTGFCVDWALTRPNMTRRPCQWTSMFGYRTILASLIAFAVAVAPVAATLLASMGARAATAAVTARHDCHGKAQQDKTGLQNRSDKAGCPDCDDGQDQTKKCIGDGVKCCKLTGMLAVLPVVVTPAENVDLAASPPTLTGWQVRPPAPPPRT